MQNNKEPGVDGVLHEAETRKRLDERIALVCDTMAFTDAIESAEGRARQVGFRRGVTLARALVSGMAVRLESDDNFR